MRGGHYPCALFACVAECYLFPVEGIGCILQWLSVPLHEGHFLLRVPVLKKVFAMDSQSAQSDLLLLS